MNNSLLIFDNNSLYTVSRTDGALVKLIEDIKFLYQPVIYKGKIYVVSDKNRKNSIFVFEGENLNLLYEWKFYNSFRNFFGFKNLIIINAKDILGFRRLFAFKL